MKIIIATKNKSKIEALKQILDENYLVYELENYDIDSNVKDSPSDYEIPLGAKNRALNAYELYRGDVFIGLETGFVERYKKIYMETWCSIYYLNKHYTGYSVGIEIPKNIAAEVINKTHDELCTWLVEKKWEKDLISYISSGKITRYDQFRSALISTLILSGII